MKYLLAIPKAVRRATAVIAAVAVTGLVAAAAVAVAPSWPALSQPSAAVLASDTSRAAATTIPACRAADLGVWVAVEQGNGTAGSIYLPLQFTNLSRHTCSLRGFPGVSAVNRNGQQLGSPAGWSHVTRARTVFLAPGATAHTLLQYSDVEVTTAPGCDPVPAAFELRVYPPGQYSATYAAFDLQVCSHAGPVYMRVGPIVPGVGTIYG
jgi:Protein of unknown function (DUF4232)